MNKYKYPMEDRIFDIVTYIMLCTIVISIAYPIIYIISCSFSSPQAVMGGRVWLLPVEFSLAGYETIFSYSAVWSGYANTIFYTVAGTFVNLAMTILAAYPLSRKDLYGRGIFTLIITFTMFFGGGMIPSYLLISKLGLINTRASMIIPSAISVWNVIITRTFFQNTIPDEMLEAARIDGCSDIKFLLRIVIPLSSTIIAVNLLFYGVGHWNSYFDALLYLNKADLHPLQMVLRRVLILNSFEGRISFQMSSYSARVGIRELLKYSLIIVATAPMMVVYPFLKNYFVKGVMIGSLKG